MASPLERLLGEREAGQLALPCDDGLQTACPVLWEFLTRQQWDSSRSREPSKVTITLASGCWLLTISEPQLSATKKGESLTWEDIPNALERLLGDITRPWIPYAKPRLPPIKK
jgi:hypothetical protein